MTKYILSSGTSVVCKILENEQFTAVKVTNKVDKAILFDTIGEAMLNASKVNELLGTHSYRVIAIET